MLDRDSVWVGDLNRVAEGGELPGSGRSVGLYDTTLRDGEQTVGVVLTPDQKLEIARGLDRLGINRIEAGFPRVSDTDAEAFGAIVEAGLDAEIWGFARAVPADVEALLELGAKATVIESPVSDGKLEAYGITRDELLRRVREAISFAVDAKVKVAFFAVDSTRSELNFLRTVYETAIEAGATEVVAVDTLGVATPEAAGFLVGKVRSWVGSEIPVHWHGHDDFGLGTAAAISAVRAGADWVQGTVNGMGERAGNADLVEVGFVLAALYGYEVSLKTEAIRELSELVREAGEYELAPWTAMVGENLFRRESGAVASQFHDPPAVEPYSSELVGASRHLVLGKKSGIDSIRLKLAELDLGEHDAEAQARWLSEVKRISTEERRLVSDAEFAKLVAERSA
jgi:isopropylmalate/homocitrate/citramalate synthase